MTGEAKTEPLHTETPGDMPSLARASDGALWLAWRRWDAAAATWQILVRCGAAASMTPTPRVLRESVTGLASPSVLATADGRVFLSWLEGDAGGWQVCAGRVEANGLIDVEKISDGDGALHACSCLDSDGVPWVAWQTGGSGSNAIILRRYADDGWSTSLCASPLGAACWRPTMTARRQGGVWVGWDAEDHGTFDVFVRWVDPARKLGELHRITCSRTLDMNATVAETPDGRVWIAWGRNRHWNDSRIYRLTPRRDLMLRCLDPETGELSVCDNGSDAAGGMVPVPRGEWGDNLTLANVVADPAGGVHVFFRHTHVPGDRTKGNYGWGWHVERMSRIGASWVGPERCGPRTGYSMGGFPVALHEASGVIACQECEPLGASGRSSNTVSGVALYPLQLPRAAEPALAPFSWHERTDGGHVRPLPGLDHPSVVASGPDEACLGRRLAGDAEGSEPEAAALPGARLVWGDLHRHSDFSKCVAAWDGSLLDHYRWARGVAGFGFYCVTDHLEHMTDADWRHCMNLAQQFHAPGSFVPLIGFEAFACPPQGMHVNVYARNPEAGMVARCVALENLYDLERLCAGIHREGVADQVFVIPHFHALVRDLSGLRFLPDCGLDIIPVIEVVQTRGWSMSFATAVADSYEKLGFTGSSDHSSPPWGRAWKVVPGWQFQHAITGLWVDELTSDGVIDALFRSRAIATNGVKMAVELSVDGHDMGESITAGAPPTVRVRAHGTTEILSAEILRDGRVVQRVEQDDPELDLEFREDTLAPGRHTYFARVVQEPEPGYHYFGEAWTTPVWVTVE